MEWAFTNDAPIYSQIVRQFQLAIASGELPPGTRLQAVRELALAAGVNPNTMQRALAELERDGLVYAQRTAGRFVTEDEGRIGQVQLDLAKSQIQSFLQAMESLGYRGDQIPALIEQFCKEGPDHAGTGM